MTDLPLWDDDGHVPQKGSRDEPPRKRIDRNDSATLLGFLPRTNDTDIRTCGLCYALVDIHHAQHHFDFHELALGDQPEFAAKLEELKASWEEYQTEEKE